MALKVPNEATIQQFVIIDNTNSSVDVLSQMTNIYRRRKILLILLTAMFIFSLFYLIFISLSCVIYTYSWLCQYFNHNYEFVWALISLICDSLWLLVAYRCYPRGLLFFAWFTIIFLLIFGIILVITLLTFLQTMMYFHMIPAHVLIASISSIILCIATSVLQIVIALFSLKLSKLISNKNKSTIC